MRNGAFYVAALVAMAVGVAPAAHAAQRVWSGLIIAENVQNPTPTPPELASIEQTLKDLFGYNQFQIIGQSHKILRTGQEDWLAASKYFSLHVDAQGAEPSGYLLNLKLYKEKDVLLEWDAKLGKESPLVIKGPLVGNGQLLLVLKIDPLPKSSAHNHHSAEPKTRLAHAWRRFSHAIRNLFP